MYIIVIHFNVIITKRSKILMTITALKRLRIADLGHDLGDPLQPYTTKAVEQSNF